MTSFFPFRKWTVYCLLLWAFFLGDQAVCLGQIYYMQSAGSRLDQIGRQFYREYLDRTSPLYLMGEEPFMQQFLKWNAEYENRLPSLERTIRIKEPINRLGLWIGNTTLRETITLEDGSELSITNQNLHVKGDYRYYLSKHFSLRALLTIQQGKEVTIPGSTARTYEIGNGYFSSILGEYKKALSYHSFLLGFSRDQYKDLSKTPGVTLNTSNIDTSISQDEISLLSLVMAYRLYIRTSLYSHFLQWQVAKIIDGESAVEGDLKGTIYTGKLQWNFYKHWSMLGQLDYYDFKEQSRFELWRLSLSIGHTFHW